MSDRLTAEELTQFGALHAATAHMHPELRAAQTKAVRNFTDLLLCAVPDLDHVAIGRVLLHVGRYISVISTGHVTDSLSDTLLMSALDLTELERGAMPERPNT